VGEAEAKETADMTIEVGHYWVLYNSDSGQRYFARFLRHRPKATWNGSTDRDAAYCFATEADARRVVDQLRSYGRRARVVTERPTPAPPLSAPSISLPPEHLGPWVIRIVEAGKASGKKTEAEQVAAGYRLLARQFHPDSGGDTSDMQHLNDAVVWIRKYLLEEDDVPF
jgi:hypothetical protein